MNRSQATEATLPGVDSLAQRHKFPYLQQLYVKNATSGARKDSPTWTA